jgi:S-DNA-T family DNA segregation ATPase FtsK/SpoIIIE
MLYCSNEKHRTPGGRYSLLYADMANQTHLLIAGRTGSGKSVVVNGIIHSLLVGRTCSEEQLILIDPKRVELSMWKAAPHCMYYAADNPVDRLHALNLAVATIERRFAEMDRAGEKKYAGGDVHVIIDELADMLTTQKTDVLPLLQRIGQIGRAAKVHLIACTQCPTAQILSTQLRCNFDSILGLRTRTPQDSRNITGLKGCEKLPEHGQGYYITPRREGIVDLPMIDETELARVAAHWSNRKLYVA